MSIHAYKTALEGPQISQIRAFYVRDAAHVIGVFQLPDAVVVPINNIQDLISVLNVLDPKEGAPGLGTDEEKPVKAGARGLSNARNFQDRGTQPG